MADNKRSSASAKVVTPRSTGTPLQAETIESLNKAVGGRIKVTIAAQASQTLEGTLYTACSTLNVIALDSRSSAANGAAPQSDDYHIIPFSRIQSFQLLSLPDNNSSGRSIAGALPAVGQVDTKRVQERLDARVRKLKEAELDRGRGVTKAGQAIFDALKRVNIPIRWHDQQMVAYDSVIISPPYRPEDCKGSKDKQQTLGQVRRVLEGETKKLKERDERERKNTTPAANQRKGG
ncbi:hypothetical protein AMS68_004194 [Peltaster fructicola]|uniref:AD domain-containing protein n=1 Tax=Peltaster fructicola TaxID=286661 RepID=A0A6H0XV96_9PEZI|nr:hypothetical protein AMS68_004194 [Peltaster fructicola]